jgi:hypothetical protein
MSAVSTFVKPFTTFHTFQAEPVGRGFRPFDSLSRHNKTTRLGLFLFPARRDEEPSSCPLLAQKPFTTFHTFQAEPVGRGFRPFDSLSRHNKTTRLGLFLFPARRDEEPSSCPLLANLPLTHCLRFRQSLWDDLFAPQLAQFIVYRLFSSAGQFFVVFRFFKIVWADNWLFNVVL